MVLAWIHLIFIENGRFFANFFERTRDLNAEERAKALDDNEEVEEAHESAAADGESKLPDVFLNSYSLLYC